MALGVHQALETALDDTNCTCTIAPTRQNFSLFATTFKLPPLRLVCHLNGGVRLVSIIKHMEHHEKCLDYAAAIRSTKEMILAAGIDRDMPCGPKVSVVETFCFKDIQSLLNCLTLRSSLSWTYTKNAFSPN